MNNYEMLMEVKITENLITVTICQNQFHTKDQGVLGSFIEYLKSQFHVVSFMVVTDKQEKILYHFYKVCLWKEKTKDFGDYVGRVTLPNGEKLMTDIFSNSSDAEWAAICLSHTVPDEYKGKCNTTSICLSSRF